MRPGAKRRGCLRSQEKRQLGAGEALCHDKGAPSATESVLTLDFSSSSSRTAAVALAGFCAFLPLYAPQPLLPMLAAQFRLDVTHDCNGTWLARRRKGDAE